MIRSYTAVAQSMTSDQQFEIGKSTDSAVAMALCKGACQALRFIGAWGWKFRVKDFDGESVFVEDLTLTGKVVQ